MATVALVVTLGLTGCHGAGGAGSATPKASGKASAAAGGSAVVPDACGLLEPGDVGDVLGSVPAPTASTLEHGESFYGRACQWGDAAGGAVGEQVGAPDDTGHDMVSNRALVLQPTFDSPAAPGAIGCMNVAVLPTGGIKGASVFFRAGSLSVLVAVSGPNGTYDHAEAVAHAVLVRLTA